MSQPAKHNSPKPKKAPNAQRNPVFAEKTENALNVARSHRESYRPQVKIGRPAGKK